MNDEYQGASDTPPVSDGPPAAEQHAPASAGLEIENDPLAENFLFLFPVALFAVLALFAFALAL